MSKENWQILDRYLYILLHAIKDKLFAGMSILSMYIFSFFFLKKKTLHYELASCRISASSYPSRYRTYLRLF